MPRRGENIYKRKDGRWEGRYIKSRSADGKALYGYVYAHSYKDVKQKLLFSAQAPLSAKSNSVPREDSLQTITFGDLADLWISSIRPQIKESTYVKYQNTLRNYILPVYKDTSINLISYSEIESFVTELLLNGGKTQKGLSPKTVQDTLSIIRAITNHAANHGYSVNSTGKGISVKQKSNDLTILSTNEQVTLHQFLINHMNNRNLGLLLCLYTGIRVGELCALQWDDISLAEKQLSVHQTMQRIQCEGEEKKTKIIITEPKSSCSIRSIPLPDVIVQTILCCGDNHKGFLLTNSENKLVEPRTMQNHFKKVLVDCGIREVNFHTLRHTFATRCVELGFDIKSLSEILGHANVNITMNRYVHPTMELKRENMNKLSSLFAVE